MKCSSERARLPLRKSDGHAGIIVTHDFICIRFHILFPQPVGCHSSIAARISISRGERVLSLDALNAAIVFSRRHSRHSRRIENCTWWHLTRIKNLLVICSFLIFTSRARRRNSRLFSRNRLQIRAENEADSWNRTTKPKHDQRSFGHHILPEIINCNPVANQYVIFD